ncbi:MAG: alpha/beta hydrolase [Saprospiraceae bacterium]|nr:alpha/beta hydrolase [Saprospiraceae bacterium]MDW8484647.1 alpha/beta hydrolase [Saprospiraceae bacterium]
MMAEFYQKKFLAAIILFLLIPQGVQGQPFPVGTRVVTYQDPMRNNRNIQTYIYYPARAGGANELVQHGRFPVVVIGHGFTMNYAPYVFWGNALAEAGYIVAIPNTETGFLPSHTALAADMAFLVNKLYSENRDSNSPFYQRVQTKACLMGHSMGGGCVYLAAQNNSNISATITFAPAETSPSAIAAAANVSCPSLVFSGSADCVTPPAQHQIPIYHALPECRAFISLLGGGHCSFAGFNFNCWFGEATCNPSGPPMPADTQRTVTLSFVRAWLDRFLKTDYSAGHTFMTLFTQYTSAKRVAGSIACMPMPAALISFRPPKSRSGNHCVECYHKPKLETNLVALEPWANGEYIGSISGTYNSPLGQYFDKNSSLAENRLYFSETADEEESTTHSTSVRECASKRLWRASFALESCTLFLHADKTERAESLVLYDTTGRLVWSHLLRDESPPIRINLPSLRPGFYRIDIHTRDCAISIPLVLPQR